MPDSNIEIDLSSSNYNHHVNSGAELIQREAFQTLRRQIRKDLDQADTRILQDNGQHSGANTHVCYPHGSGLTYFIDGTRGAGKSTFLNFTYEHLDKRQQGTIESDAVSVKPLLYLDPSRIESSEIVLLHILKHLKHLMEGCSHRGQDWGKQQEVFRDLFKQMAGGLHLFVSKTESLKDLDAELFLDYGLDRAADSQRLRHLLHQTIDLVCKVHNTRALLVAIDDADTKFAQAIEVLECIRKYLDTPQMVVLLTGDMEMYSLLVQNHFQQDFASDDKGFSPDRKMQQTRMVAHLEEQYLLKLFPIQRRVQLKTLHTLTERKRKDSKPGAPSSLPEFVIKRPGGDDAVTLLDGIDDIATSGLRLRDRLDLDLFREHVLKLPLRSVLQLLSSYYQLSNGGNASEREAAAEALRATALSSLYRHDIDVESIAEGDLHAVINAAFDLCQLDGEPDTAIYLRPQSRDATLRNAYVSLAADVARLCEHDPAKAITYMVSMAGSSNILHLVTVKTTQKSRAREAGDARDESTRQRKVKQYLSVGRKDNALNWALHATAALMGASATSGLQLRQGIIGVRTSSKSGVLTFDNSITNALKANPKNLYPAIAFSQSAVKSPSNTQRYLSIFNTLGLISNLLDFDNIDRDEDDIHKQLLKIMSVQTVSMPNWDEDANTETDEAEDDNNGVPTGFIELGTHIKNWLAACQALKLLFRPSAMLMGKIWNRLYFSLDNISAAMRLSSYDNVRCGKAMELFAWALINACLVEEVDYHHRADKSKREALNRRNPRTSGTLVIKKLQSPDKSDAEGGVDVTPAMAPLTFMIATCPLVLGLIKQEDETTSFISCLNAKLNTAKIPLKIPDSALCSANVWDQIAKTEVSK
ncbi:P-loop NTPase fold protein [Vogesella indigofera]|uniref:P-loop NTPase fold protein n=1 Tax=Vogesella indigofera TaxID=45465 RepID=UPI00234F80C7|nr:P-loop NTPase fold protein [Vogesella indigofera]MDC7709264.1 hypothetical protein [Vogesella indigofera]